MSVSQPGQVQALNCGLRSVRTPLVAITDDDARPHIDWIERICAHFADPTVGAVGGHDIIYWEVPALDGSTTSSAALRGTAGSTEIIISVARRRMCSS